VSADGISLPPKMTSARPAGAARRLGYINQATGRKRAWQLLWRFSDAGYWRTVPRARLAGVGKPAREEIAGRKTRAVCHALWRF